MQKVLPRFAIAWGGPQVCSLLGEFKPCPFERRKINLYVENKKKYHHFMVIRNTEFLGLMESIAALGTDGNEKRSAALHVQKMKKS